MRAQTIAVQLSAGRILSSAIFRTGGRKLLSRGHLLRDEDVRVLESEGMRQIWVTELEEGEISEDDAVCAVASEIACGCYETTIAAGGRANLTATQNCCVLVDDQLLRQANCATGLVIASALNFSYALAGQRIATVKSAPFAVSRSELERLAAMLRERGPVLQARPVKGGSVAVLYTDPKDGDRARTLFEPVMRQKLEKFGLYSHAALSVLENEEHVSRGLQQLGRTKPSAILVASTTAPAGPMDVVGRAMAKIGCHMERFLAPVEPGNLMLMSYKDDVPILSAPGCFRSLKPNIIDLMLPPMIARYHVSTQEIANLGHGGLLA